MAGLDCVQGRPESAGYDSSDPQLGLYHSSAITVSQTWSQDPFPGPARVEIHSAWSMEGAPTETSDKQNELRLPKQNVAHNQLSR